MQQSKCWSKEYKYSITQEKKKHIHTQNYQRQAIGKVWRKGKYKSKLTKSDAEGISFSQ